MNYNDRIYSVRFSSAGHYVVTFTYYNDLYSATITDMTLIDAYKDEEATESDARRLYFAAKRKTIN